MKNFIIIFILTIATSPFVAQSIIESQLKHNDQLRPALQLQVDIPKELAFNYFEEFFKDIYKINLKGDGFLSGTDELYFEKEKISTINEKDMDLYAQFKSVAKEQTAITIVVREGYDLYFSKQYKPEIQTKLSDLLTKYDDYAKEAYRNHRINILNQKIAGLERDQKKSLGDIQKNESDIKKNLKENQELAEEIKKIRERMDTRNNEMEKLKSYLKSIK